MTPPDALPPPPTSPAGLHRAARRVRRWLGPRAVDTMFATDGADASARALLANEPRVGVQNVHDGQDLLADRMRDHPHGLPSERWGTRLARVRNVCLAVAIIGILGMLVTGLVLTRGSSDQDPFEALGEWLSPTAATVAGVVVGGAFVIGVLLIWPLNVWRHLITLGEARYAVRWAAQRPGQAARGLPVADPFVGLGGVLMGLSVIVWILAGFVLFGTVIIATWPAAWIAGLALVAVGWLLFRARKAMRDAAAVAGSHLLLLGHRDDGLRLDVATSVQERFVLLTQGFLPFVGERWITSWERTVYPLTADLSPEEIARRHDQADQDSEPGLRLVGDRSTAPLVTIFTPEASYEEQAARIVDLGPYAGGWMVARTRNGDREAVIIVEHHPERFLDEVLPLFGDRHGLDLTTIERIEPIRLPDGPGSMAEWTPPPE